MPSAIVTKLECGRASLCVLPQACQTCHGKNHCLTLSRLWQRQNPLEPLQVEFSGVLQVGQRVTLVWSDAHIMKAVAILYGLPLLTLLLFASITTIFTHREGVVAVMAFMGLILGASSAKMSLTRCKIAPKIVEPQCLDIHSVRG